MKKSLALALVALFFPLLSWASLDLATYNIRNFPYDSRAEQQTNKTLLKRVLLGLDADLVAVQEVVDDEEFRAFVDRHLPGYEVILTRCGGRGRQKLGFVYDKSKLRLKSFYEDDRLSLGEGCDGGLRPAAVGHFEHRKNNFDFIALSLHLKAGGSQRNADVRAEQYEHIGHILDGLRNKGERHFVLMGDFNTTDYVLRNQNYERFQRFVEKSGLIDFSSRLECTSYWWGGVDDGLEHPSLLDHIMVSGPFYSQFPRVWIDSKAHCQRQACHESSPEELGDTFMEVSDHCPIVANMQ